MTFKDTRRGCHPVWGDDSTPMNLRSKNVPLENKIDVSRGLPKKVPPIENISSRPPHFLHDTALEMCSLNESFTSNFTRCIPSSGWRYIYNFKRRSYSLAIIRYRTLVGISLPLNFTTSSDRIIVIGIH